MADPTGSGSNGGTTTVVSNPPNLPTTNTIPNTTTDTKTTEFQTSTPQSSTSTSPPIAVSYPGGTYLFNSQAELDAYSQNPNDYASSFVGSGYTVTKTALPQTKVAVDTNNGGEGFGLGTPDGNGGFVNAQGDPVDSNGTPIAGVPPTTYSSPVNDPLAGLTPTQLKDLGGADPTDPYIRARLGIPQLPGSTLNATPGFGFGNLTTNLPSIDGALGTIKSLFSGVLGGGTGGGSGLSSLFTNFASTVGGLFGSTPTASATAATTGSGTAALVAPAGPSTTLAPVDPTTTEGFGIQATVDPTTLEGYGIQATVDPTTLEGYGVPSTTGNTMLTADQTDALFSGTDMPTTAQVQAQDQQLAADAAKLYPGTHNKALLNIDKGYAAIEENTAGIANAEKIVAANNAELADPATSDARRAELLANNDAQQQYIQVATENSAIQQNVIEQNANVYAAGGGNEGSGQDPTGVLAAEDQALAEQAAAQGDAAAFDNLAVGPADPTGVLAAEDQAIADEEAAAYKDLSVGPRDPYGVLAAEDEALAQDEAAAFANQSVGPRDPYGVLAAEDQAIADEQAAQSDAAAYDNLSQAPTGVDPTTLEGYGVQENGATAPTEFGALADSQGSQQAAIVAKAKQQATIQARYKQPGNTDWRVRLSLGPGAQYLYNATPAGVLAPLKANGGTDGVIFPYTPSITTTYSANYEQYDLIHSNYRGLFYKNSRVGDIQLRGTFTAQDTTEANYLLAVIHFFRSVTKMFYGQDAERGTPPPICLLNGFGGYQFSDHPVVISQFNYTLPNDVDYIRTTNPNNFGLNLNNRYNPSGASLPAGGALAGLNRLLNAIPNGLPKGALPRTPAPNTVAGSVTNNVPASYVPTKMEIDVTLIPVQSRSQVSQQFSLKGFANGDLLKGGFW